jgi:hypothetical protein
MEIGRVQLDRVLDVTAARLAQICGGQRDEKRCPGTNLGT